MNPLMSMINSKVGGNKVMLQALNAAMKNESPEDFLRDLAKTDPRFANLDLNNLEKTAQDLCRKNGVDPEALKMQIESFIQQNT